MTEEKQKEIPSLESIVGEMGKIAALSNIYNQYDYAENPSEKGELLRVAATVLSNARDGAEFNATYNQLEGEGFSDKLKYSRDRRVEQIGEAYEARRNEILSRIVDKLNKDLKDVGASCWQGYRSYRPYVPQGTTLVVICVASPAY